MTNHINIFKLLIHGVRINLINQSQYGFTYFNTMHNISLLFSPQIIFEQNPKQIITTLETIFFFFEGTLETIYWMLVVSNKVQIFLLKISKVQTSSIKSRK